MWFCATLGIEIGLSILSAIGQIPVSEQSLLQGSQQALGSTVTNLNISA